MLIFTKPNAECFIPDGRPQEAALADTRTVGIGAHQDDLELMALHGIAAHLSSPIPGFCGITCSDGARSPRIGKYAELSVEELILTRRAEQRQAAALGRYAAMFQLDFTTFEVRSVAGMKALASDLASILMQTRVETVYTHNPLDKHTTHVAVCISVIDALRGLPADRRPQRVIGCEAWRNLDWMPDQEKILLDVTGLDELARALVNVFDSQNAGGKRYDLAAEGRRVSNATFFESHGVDQASALSFGIDLTPLIHDSSITLEQFALNMIERFKGEVTAQFDQLK